MRAKRPWRRTRSAGCRSIRRPQEHRFEHDGTTYYFCCDGCRTKFAADPARYLAAEPAPHAHHHHHAEPAAPGVGVAVKDPVCGMSVDPATARHKADHAGATYSFCSGGCREKFVANPAKYLAPQPAKPADAAPGVMYTCPMHPQIRQLGPGILPDLRHGARAGGPDGGDGAESRTRRHETTLLDRPRAGRSGIRPRDGRASDRSSHADPRQGLQLDSVRAGDAGRAVGRLAVLRTRLGLRQDAQSQHVHPDRDGHGRGLGLQRDRHLRARRIPAGLPRRGRLGPRLFRGRGGHHRAGAARAGAGIARAGADRRRDPGASRPCAEDGPPPPCRRDRRGRAPRTGRGRRPIARAPRATRCRSTGRSSRERAPSTSSWSQANRCRSPRPQASGSSAEP